MSPYEAAVVPAWMVGQSVGTGIGLGNGGTMDWTRTTPVTA